MGPHRKVWSNSCIRADLAGRPDLCASARRLGPHPHRVWACASTLKKLRGDSLDAVFIMAAALQLAQLAPVASGSSIVFSVAGAARLRTRPASTCMLPATLQASTASASIAHLDTIPAPALSTTASCLSLFYYLSHRFGPFHFPFRTQKYYSRLVVRGTEYGFIL